MDTVLELQGHYVGTNIREGRIKSMIKIDEYIQSIYDDFKIYIESWENLCKLKNLTFEAGILPDYTDVNIQQLYLLRYAFAYGFEYSNIYEDVLSKMGNRENISVVSVGCGAMIDYWGLIYAIENKHIKCNVRYVGIDEINWNYKIQNRNEDEVHFCEGNAAELFSRNKEFVSDVYCFPKSISEFSEDEIQVVLDAFSEKPILKNSFFVCISIREDQGSMDRDTQRTKSIIDAIESNGFTTTWPYTRYTKFRENKGIVLYDYNFCYPDNVLEYMKKLNTECKVFIEKGSNCKSNCLTYLNRWPMLKSGHIKYQVISFERK